MVPTTVCHGASDTITGSICVMDGNSIFLSNFWDSILCLDLDIGVWPPEPGPDTRYSVAAALWCLGLGALNHKGLSFLFLSIILSIIFYDLMRLTKNSKFNCSRHVCPLNVPRVQWTQTMCGREEHFRIDTQIMRTLECQLVPITNSAISNGFNTET